MNAWKRIRADDLQFGKHVVEFSSPSGDYSIVVNENCRPYVRVAFRGKNELWPIAMKFENDNELKICGMADWVPEILDEPCWYELVLGLTAHITYWSNQVIVRTDRPSSLELE